MNTHPHKHTRVCVCALCAQCFLTALKAESTVVSPVWLCCVARILGSSRRLHPEHRERRQHSVLLEGEPKVFTNPNPNHNPHLKEATVILPVSFLLPSSPSVQPVLTVRVMSRNTVCEWLAFLMCSLTHKGLAFFP